MRTREDWREKQNGCKKWISSRMVFVLWLSCLPNHCPSGESPLHREKPNHLILNDLPFQNAIIFIFFLFFFIVCSFLCIPWRQTRESFRASSAPDLFAQWLHQWDWQCKACSTQIHIFHMIQHQQLHYATNCKSFATKFSCCCCFIAWLFRKTRLFDNFISCLPCIHSNVQTIATMISSTNNGNKLCRIQFTIRSFCCIANRKFKWISNFVILHNHIMLMSVFGFVRTRIRKHTHTQNTCGISKTNRQYEPQYSINLLYQIIHTFHN